MIARTLAVLSLCGLLGLALLCCSLMQDARRLKALPVWPDKSGDILLLEEGNEGSWSVAWDPVANAVGNGTLSLETGFYWPDLEGLSVKARLTPRDAFAPDLDREQDSEGWMEVHLPRNEGSQLGIDPQRLRAIDYRVISVPEEMKGRQAWFAVDGSGDSHHSHGADHLEMAAWVAAFKLGIPLGLILIVVFIRQRQVQPPAESAVERGDQASSR